jgi:DNA primase
MGILPEDVARVRAASDLVAIAAEHIALKRVGRQFQGLCPFHAEKSPSFSVNPQLGVYYCFGCGAKGDAITFVREVEHLDFAEAVERLAGRAGVQIRYEDGGGTAGAERKRLALLRETLGRAIDWYHERLLSSPDAAAARHYLRERGYDGDVVRGYRLGWAPEGWDTLARALKLPDDLLRDTGLGFVAAGGRRQDGFRARVLFPIFDARGEPVGLGGRSLPGGPSPKYRNSPETPLYKKSRVLYGLNWAKGAVVEAQEVVICEGYTDVIGLHQAGVRQAVATCGTALGEEHVQVLKNFARRLVLAYDADAAGQAAAERVYEWERKHEIDVAVVALPAGKDPADLARSDPERLRHAVVEARPFLAFRLERLLGGADLRSAEGRARAAEGALDMIAGHPSELVRDQYVMEVASRTGIDPDRLRERLRAGGRAGAARLAERPAIRAERRGEPHRAEIEVLRIAVHEPEQVADRLHEMLFEPGVGRRAYVALASAETLHDAIDGATGRGDTEVADLLQRLAVEEPWNDADDALAMLVRVAAGRALPQYRGKPEIAWLKPTLDELSEPDTKREATDRLVRWLATAGTTND